MQWLGSIQPQALIGVFTLRVWKVGFDGGRDPTETEMGTVWMVYRISMLLICRAENGKIKG
jgi:hypothetical protein